MNITKTDKRWIEKLLEEKPNATARDLLKLIEELNVTDMRHGSHVDYLIDRIIRNAKM